MATYIRIFVYPYLTLNAAIADSEFSLSYIKIISAIALLRRIELGSDNHV